MAQLGPSPPNSRPSDHCQRIPVIETFLAAHTTALATLQQRAQAHSGPDNDFLLVQQRPLLEFAPDAYLCIDPGFLLEKAGRRSTGPSTTRAHRTTARICSGTGPASSTPCGILSVEPAAFFITN